MRIGRTNVIGARLSTATRAVVVVPVVIFSSGPLEEDQRNLLKVVGSDSSSAVTSFAVWGGLP